MSDGADGRPVIRERRLTRTRHSIEFKLDTAFRPLNWAAALSYRLGLQGRLRVSQTTVEPAHRETAPARKPLRVAFASDFHAGATTDGRLLARACDALTALRPDVLLLGGDFVSVRASDIERLAPLLEKIPAPFGKFGVPGNHDLRANFRVIAGALERVGVQMLTNRCATLAPPFGDVTICGLDDAKYGAPRMDAAMDGATGRRIVLMHSPEGLRAIGDRPFDLALCGHTHGGQVALPGGRPILMPGGALNHRYYGGQFALEPAGSRTLLVSHGIGCSTLPLRMFAAPEVHLCLIV